MSSQFSVGDTVRLIGSTASGTLRPASVAGFDWTVGYPTGQSVSVHNSEIELVETKASTPEIPAFEEQVNDWFEELQILLLRKHQAYGPGNIAHAPGGPMNGLLVRMHDKMERIKHLHATGIDPADEPFTDSLIDLANYCVIALLVLDGSWPE